VFGAESVWVKSLNKLNNLFEVANENSDVIGIPEKRQLPKIAEPYDWGSMSFPSIRTETIPLDLKKGEPDQARLLAFLNGLTVNSVWSISIGGILPRSTTSADAVAAFSATEKVLLALIGKGVPRTSLFVERETAMGGPALTLTLTTSSQDLNRMVATMPR
jgi:hypothetical protein